VLDASAKAPAGVDLLCNLCIVDRDVGEQDDLAPEVRGVGDQRPEIQLGVGQAEREPAEADGHPAGLVGMLEGNFEAERPGHGSGQFAQGFFTLPAL